MISDILHSVRTGMGNLSDLLHARFNAGEGNVYALIKAQCGSFYSISKVPVIVCAAVWLCHQIKHFVEWGVGAGDFRIRPEKEADIETGHLNESGLADFRSITVTLRESLNAVQLQAFFSDVRNKLLSLKEKSGLYMSQESLDSAQCRQIKSFLSQLYDAEQVIQSQAHTVRNFCTMMPLIHYGADYQAISQYMAVIPPLQEERLEIWNTLKPVLEELRSLECTQALTDITHVAERIRPYLEQSNRLSAAIHAQHTTIMNILPVGMTVARSDYLKWVGAIGARLTDDPVEADFQQYEIMQQDRLDWFYEQIEEEVTAFFDQQGLEGKYAVLKKPLHQHFVSMLTNWVKTMIWHRRQQNLTTPENMAALQDYAGKYFDGHSRKTPFGEMIVQGGYTPAQISAMERYVYANHPIVTMPVWRDSAAEEPDGASPG